MSRLLLVLAMLAALGGGAFVVARRVATCDASPAARHHTAPLAVDRLPELDWLERRLGLTPDESAKVRELHVAYLPECAAMCARIDEAEARLREVSLSSDGMTAEVEAAVARSADVRRDCQQRLLRHLYRTAACMDDTRAARYLRLVLPAALGHPPEPATAP